MAYKPRFILVIIVVIETFRVKIIINLVSAK